MKNLIMSVLLAFVPLLIFSQQGKINVIVFGAHPDDCDGKAGGTAIEFAKRGHNVLFVSITDGSAGHQEIGGAPLANIRKLEAQEAGKRFGIKYLVLDHPDGKLMPTLEIRDEIIRLIRQWNADIVIVHRPNDYHPDHRYTSTLVQDAAYMVIVPNIVPDTPPLKKNPVFLYMEDNFQKPQPFSPDIVIDITDSWDQKIYALAAHVSQMFEWLPWTSGTLDKVPAGEAERLEWLKKTRYPRELSKEKMASLIKWYGAERAKKVKFAESFEICEYGRHPSEKEIRELFPMMIK
ncbi:MAG TPA: PIG-L family deacetylase [Bacteroidales bacterium]|nr:PIG-L family deacetylase [Bacteroidales bacterium]HCI54614.1 GlcNAc-PI de-N-acetylase [Bacteroidales bacterium]HOU95586.1 PIG-L family deacetylase [Bacteroidales bacterium]HQG36998.1 PIG-L family deacetylase [Bacteroidales bacterium]HQG53160.1 PIG-L family deacetylase [Bacteroidales bacterium]